MPSGMTAALLSRYSFVPSLTMSTGTSALRST